MVFFSEIIRLGWRQMEMVLHGPAPWIPASIVMICQLWVGMILFAILLS